MPVIGNSLRKFQIKGFQSTLQTLINDLYMLNTHYHIFSIQHDCSVLKQSYKVTLKYVSRLLIYIL